MVARRILACLIASFIAWSSWGGDSRTGETIRLDLPNSDAARDEDEDLEEIAEIILFYANPYEGECFVFCCDKSASMSSGYGGRLKIHVLKEELIRALMQISAMGEFAIVFFDSGLEEYKDRPVVAGGGERERAIWWVMARQVGRWTCLAEAGVRSVGIANRSEKANRAIIILTDGVPTCMGAHTEEQCLRDITAANTQRIPVHTIGIPADEGENWNMEFLRELAAMNSGTFRVAAP